MKIKVINPATKIPEETVQDMEIYLKKYLRRDTILEFQGLENGLPSIETEAQGIINGAEMLSVIGKIKPSEYDGIFVNCFDDPALIAAREISAIPVMGPYAPSISFASLLSDRIAVITTDDYGIICEERKAKRYGFQISAIKKVDLTVLDLNNGPLIHKVVTDCRELEKEGIYAAVLGCTGMSTFAEFIQKELKSTKSKVQIIEPMRCGLMALEHMISGGYTNKVYSTPIRTER